MLYSFVNSRHINLLMIDIPETKKSILFNYCKTKFNQYLPKYNKDEATLLIDMLVYILYIMAKNLHIGNTTDYLNIFLKQISMNNDRNFIALVNLFLPYIDDKNNNYNQNNINNFINTIESTNNKKTDFSNYIYDHNHITAIKNIKEDNIKTLDIGVNNTIPPSENTNIEYEYYKVMAYFILDIFNRIRYKFYINWINTFPITLETYKNTTLYKSSWKYNEEIQKIMFTDSENNEILLNFPLYLDLNNKDYIIDRPKIYEVTGESVLNINTLINNSMSSCILYNGINLEDVYNTIINDYYLSIKRNKWLLFEFSIDNKIQLIIQILHNLFDIDSIINEKIWYLLDDSLQSTFSTKWALFLNAVSNKNSISSYDYTILEGVFISFVSYFELHYKGIIKLKKDKLYKYLQNNIQDDEDEELLEFVNGQIIFKNSNSIVILTIEDYINSIKDVPAEFIYEFLYEEINSIKNTPYNYMLFKDSAVINSSDYNIQLKVFSYDKINLNDTENYILTPKNYYNYAKSLLFKSYRNNSRYYDEENLLYANLWDSLSVEDKYITTIRFNQLGDTQNWFNISNILKKIKYDTSKIKKYTEIIYNKIKSKLIDLTFINLIRKGCICKFEYNPQVSDSAILTNDYKIKNKRLAENMKKYVLTPDKKKEYKQAYYYANNKKYKDMDDIQIEYKNKQKNYNYIDYLSEMEITGDKWFTFYAVDWVSQIDFYLKFVNQRVMYITGSTGQGKSTQVPKLYLYGLKSLLYKNNGKIFCTAPRIDPVVENAKGISKSMGIPIENYEEHYKNPIPTFNGTVQYAYSSNNHVNINSNYFLRIMTDGKLLQLLYGNQMLKEQQITNKENKLNPTNKMNNRNICDIIMIDEAHEHNANMDIILTIIRYSLFYNNDIKLSIISATMEDDEPIFRKFYRYIDDNLTYPINMFNLNNGTDRNFIDRRYHISPPGMTTQHEVHELYEDTSPDTYDDNEKLAIERVQTIFESTSSGDILLFSTTENKIIDLVELLNKQIPNNCIALPYHGKLNQIYKDFSKHANEKIKQITFDRGDVINIFTGILDKADATKVNPGTYTRVCIIATNAAEASLTISSLKYIIDIGYALIVKYNYDTLQSEPQTQKITEASRIQRKGRVGRVSSGTIYHMYPQNSREEIKAEYNISITNFSDSFRDLLTNDDNKKNEIFDADILYKLMSMQKLTKDEINNISPNRKIIYDQYKIGREYFKPDNQIIFINTSNTQLKPEYFNYLFPSYYSGFSSSNLLDISGHFYIINPLEGILKRDINTSQFIDQNNNIIYLKQKDINKVFQSAKINLEIIDAGTNNLYKNNSVLEFNQINSIINIGYDNVYLKLVALSLIMDDSKDYHIMNKVIFIYRLLLMDETSIVSPNKSIGSDLDSYSYIFDYIIKFIKFDLINNKINYKNEFIYEKIHHFILNNKINYKNLVKFSKDKFYDYKTCELLFKLILKGNITLNNINKESNNILSKPLIKEELLLDKTLIQFCNINDLDYNNIVTTFTQSISEYMKIKLNIDEMKDSIENLKKILNLSIPDNITEKVKLIFFYSHISNIYYINDNKFYSLYNSQEFKPQYGSLKNLSTLGFYLLSDNLKNLKLIFSNLTKSDILNIAPQIILYIKNQGKKYLSYKDIQNNIEFILKKINHFSYSNTSKDQQFTIDNMNIQDKNISNILMKRIMNNTKRLDNTQNGGLYLIRRPISMIKIHIDTIKKMDNLKELAKKFNLNLDEFHYGYVAYNIDNLVGFYLCKIMEPHVILMNVVLNNYPGINTLVARLRYKGIQIIIKKN